MATKAAELYDEDFYAWTVQQAAVLRSLSHRDNRLDVGRLAEEVEDLGKSELHAVESFVEQIIAYLLKLDYSGQDQPRRHWRAEVLNFRRSVGRKMTPSIRRMVEAGLHELYERAREMERSGRWSTSPI